MMNKTGVELGKADEFCHIANKVGVRPGCQRSVL